MTGVAMRQTCRLLQPPVRSCSVVPSRFPARTEVAFSKPPGESFRLSQMAGEREALSFVAPTGLQLPKSDRVKFSGNLFSLSRSPFERTAPRRRSRATITMLRGRDDDGPSGSVDDARLNHELRMKVKELYGSAENVSIESNGDSVEFRVMRSPDGGNLTEYRSAVFTVQSIVVMSIVAIIGFAAMVKIGAVHDGAVTERTYEMPTYGKSSYVNPYELLQEEPLAPN